MSLNIHYLATSSLCRGEIKCNQCFDNFQTTIETYCAFTKYVDIQYIINLILTNNQSISNLGYPQIIGLPKFSLDLFSKLKVSVLTRRLPLLVKLIVQTDQANPQ